MGMLYGAFVPLLTWGHEIEVLSVGSPTEASEEEVAGPFYA